MFERTTDLIIAYKDHFSTERGKMILDDMRKISKIDISSIPTSRSEKVDPCRIAHDEGLRDFYRIIMTYLDYPFDKLEELRKEEDYRIEEDKREREKEQEYKLGENYVD